jgi:type I restriction enzyme S subunit
MTHTIKTVKKATNTPKLRFAGFSGAWEEKKLGEVSDVRDGTHDSPKYHKNGYPFITSKNLRSDGTIDLDNVNLISAEDFKKVNKRSKVDQGDILFGMIGTIGNPVLVKGCNFAIKNVALIKEKETLKNNFLFQYLKSDYIANQFYHFNAGGTQKFLSLSIVRNLKIPLPQTTEQKKIADFLGAVDEWIENLRAQKETLESYKKGIMQKIFSQQIRFKDTYGKSFPNWEEKKLGEVAEIIMGQSPESSAYNSEGLGIPLIQGNADITERETTPRNWTTQITKECKIGDIIMTVRAPVGYICKSLHNACIGRGVCSIRNKEKSDIDYLFQYLLTFEKKWISLEQGSTFTAVNTKDVKNLQIPSPSLGEQQKIADFLTSVDKVIESKQQQITQAEEWKKGLMQGLFV